MADLKGTKSASKPGATKSLTSTQLKIIGVLDDEYCYPYHYICDETELDIKIVRPAIQELKALGYVKVVHGLMNEDGEVAGSGFCIVYEHRDGLKQQVYDFEKAVTNFHRRQSYERLKAEFEGNDLGLVDPEANESVTNPQ